MALAAATGLAAAAVVAGWSRRRHTLAAVALFAGSCGVVSRVVAGRSENLLIVALTMASLGVLMWGRGRARWVAFGAMVFAAGITESPFLAAFLAVVAVATAFDAVAGRMFGRRGSGRHRYMERDDVDGDAAVPAGITLSKLAAVAAVGGGAAALVVTVWNGAAPTDAIQRLPPAATFRPRLFAELGLVWWIPAMALVAAAWHAARRHATRATRPLMRLLSVWLVGIVVVLLAGAAGLPLPTYRALTFGVPIVLALGVAPIVASAAPRARRAVAVAAAVVAVGPSIAMWYSHFGTRTTPEQLAQLVAAGSYVAELPGDGAAILVMDHPDPLRTFLYQRVAEATLPAGLAPRVVVLPGRLEDALGGRPTVRGDQEDREVVLDVFAEVRPLLETGAPILAARDFDTSGFAAAVARGAPRVGDVAVARGPAPRAASSAPSVLNPLPPWWWLFGQAVGFLLLLAICGAGWAARVGAGAPAEVRAALAPACGAAAVATLTLVLVHAGIRPWPYGGIVAVAVSACVSLALYAARRRGAAGVPTGVRPARVPTPAPR